MNRRTKSRKTATSMMREKGCQERPTRTLRARIKRIQALATWAAAQHSRRLPPMSRKTRYGEGSASRSSCTMKESRGELLPENGAAANVRTALGPTARSGGTR